MAIPIRAGLHRPAGARPLGRLHLRGRHVEAGGQPGRRHAAERQADRSRRRAIASRSTIISRRAATDLTAFTAGHRHHRQGHHRSRCAGRVDRARADAADAQSDRHDRSSLTLACRMRGMPCRSGNLIDGVCPCASLLSCPAFCSLLRPPRRASNCRYALVRRRPSAAPPRPRPSRCGRCSSSRSPGCRQEPRRLSISTARRTSVRPRTSALRSSASAMPGLTKKYGADLKAALVGKTDQADRPSASACPVGKNRCATATQVEVTHAGQILSVS